MKFQNFVEVVREGADDFEKFMVRSQYLKYFAVLSFFYTKYPKGES